MGTIKIRALKSALFEREHGKISLIAGRIYRMEIPETEEGRARLEQLINLGFVKLIANPAEKEVRSSLPLPNGFLSELGETFITPS